jgi:hypothetical protein
MVRFQNDVARLDRQLASTRHGVARVDRHVDDDALQLTELDTNGPQVASQRRRQSDVLSQRPAQHFGDPHHVLVQLDYLGIDMPPPREGKEPFGKLGAEASCFLLPAPPSAKISLPPL